MPSTSLEAMLAPIDVAAPVGYFDEEEATFQAIDQEMIKQGGLRQATLDWAYVEQAAPAYLATQCKHFRIASHLITAWLREATWVRWVHALELLAGMVVNYWDIGYPKPGPTGYPTKRKHVAAMIERLTQAVASLESTILPEAHGARALKALAALRSEVPHAQLQAPPLERLVRCLDAARERAQQPPAPPAVSPTAFPATSPAISPAFFASTPAIALGNERETRQSLLKIADYLNQRDAYDPVGYQLRRVALWSELNSAPTARTDQRTELRNVPVDITYVYEDALVSQDASPPLLQRVEKSVAASPFWLRGSFLAATFARRLAMPDVADGIQQAAMRFLQRLPTLAQLRFHDGAPFVDDVTLSWLSENHASRSSDGETAEFAQRRAELMACLDNDGVETTLLRLQHMQAQATTPRQRGQVTCIAADVLAARGLTWLADGLYAVVRQTMETTSADQWEPEFHRELTPLDTRFRA